MSVSSVCFILSEDHVHPDPGNSQPQQSEVCSGSSGSGVRNNRLSESPVISMLSLSKVGVLLVNGLSYTVQVDETLNFTLVGVFLVKDDCTSFYFYSTHVMSYPVTRS